MTQKPEGALQSIDSHSAYRIPEGHYWVGSTYYIGDEVIFGFHQRTSLNPDYAWRTIYRHSITHKEIEPEGFSFTNYFLAWAYYLSLKRRLAQNETEAKEST